MSTMSRRVEFRVDPETSERISKAAELLQENVSDFVRSASVARAETVLARSDTVLMPAAQFDALIDSLDVADPAPALAEAATRRHRFTRV